jgi:sec-independent protein translocase protein TatB
MFDFSWSELAVIGTLALVFIGPKDLPKALRTAGMLARKARSISREFQHGVEELIREAELDDVRRHFDEARHVDLSKETVKLIDPTGSVAEGLKLPHSEPSQGMASPQHLAQAEPAAAPALSLTEPAGVAAAPVQAEAEPAVAAVSDRDRVLHHG